MTDRFDEQARDILESHGLLDVPQALQNDIAKALREAAPVWRPIETYPGNGDPVLVRSGKSVGEATYYPDASPYDAGWWWAGTHPTDATDGRVYPTHWQPLPAPPETL